MTIHTGDITIGELGEIANNGFCESLCDLSTGALNVLEMLAYLLDPRASLDDLPPIQLSEALIFLTSLSVLDTNIQIKKYTLIQPKTKTKNLTIV